MTSQARNEKSRSVNWGHSMALNHLPPKSPAVSSSIAPPYPGCVRLPSYSSGHRRSPSASFVPDVEPSWLEELLDSPKAPERRVSHRRSASDSMTFLEAPSNLRKIDDIAEEDEAESTLAYDREDQLASMFSEAVQISQATEAWSQQDRRHQSQLRPYPADLSYAAARMVNEAELHDNEQLLLQGDQNSDVKRSKRQSAQRSRVRKLQYIHELEGNVSDLQNEVSGLSTQVALLEHQRLALHIDNSALKQNVAALAQEARLKDAHSEALKKEIQRLRFLKQQQQQQRLRQQLALASSAAAGHNVETTTAKHVRRSSAGSVQEIGSASDVLDSFVKFVEKTDTPVLRSSCTLAGNGKNLEVGASRLPGAPPPGFVVPNHL